MAFTLDEFRADVQTGSNAIFTLDDAIRSDAATVNLDKEREARIRDTVRSQKLDTKFDTPFARKQALDEAIAGVEAATVPSDKLQEARQVLRDFEAIPTQDPEERLEELRRDQIAKIPRSVRPLFTAVAVKTMRNASLVARAAQAVGLDIDVADELSREAGRISAARAALGTSTLEDVVETVTSSFLDVLTFGGFGLKPLIMAQGIGAGNDAITQGRDAGLEGLQLATFASNQAAIEIVTTAIFGKFLGGGIESLARGSVLKATTKKGILSVIKRIGLGGLAEMPEESTIELLNAVSEELFGVDPEALSPKSLLPRIKIAALAGFAGGGTAGLIQSAAARQVKEKAPKPTPVPDASEDSSVKIQRERTRRVIRAAKTDSLTKLGNRKLDNQVVAGAFNRVDETGQPAALVRIDLNNFKAINDNISFEAGDKALTIVGDVLLEETRTERTKDDPRPRDIVGIATRPTGDEFNVILPDTDSAGADIVIERIKTKINARLAEAGLSLPKPNRPVFAAFGVAVRQPGDTRTIAQIRQDADLAMKRDKAAGKRELGIPLLREDVEAEPTEPAKTPTAPIESKLAPSKAKEIPTTPPKEGVARKPLSGPSKPRRRAAKAVLKRKKGQPQIEAAEAKKALATKPEATKRIFFGTGFRAAARRGREQLRQVKEELKQQEKTKAALNKTTRKNLVAVVKNLLPLSEQGKLLTALADPDLTPRQTQTLRGRVVTAVERVEHRDAKARFLKVKKNIKFSKLEQAVIDTFGEDTIDSIKTVSRPALNEMTSEQINVFADRLDAITALQKDLKNLRLGTAAKSLDDLSVAVKQRLVKTGKFEAEDTESVGLVKGFFNEQNTKPEELMTIMDGDEDGPIRQALYTKPKEGMTKTLQIQRQAKEFFDKNLPLTKMRKWSRQQAGRNVQTLTVRLEGGKDLKLTKNEFVYLLASARTEANKAAILKSGLTLRRQRSKARHKITEKDFALFEAVAGTIDPDISKAANTIKTYLNNVLKPQYDAAHIELNGFSNIIEDYLPIRRNVTEILPKVFDIGSFNKMALAEIRETKERVGGQASVMIDDAFAMMDNHVRRVSGFIGLARIMRNANLVLNHPRVAKAMDEKFGTQRRRAFNARNDHIVQDLVGYRPTGNNFLSQLANTFIDNASKGVLGLNLGVIAKQPVSLVLASTETEAKWLKRGIGAFNAFSKLGKDVDARMMKHSSDIWSRYQGPRLRLVGQFVDKADANILDKGRGLGDKAMIGISFADRSALRVIWRGSEIKISETTNLAFGTDEYFIAVAKEANRVIDRTQPAFGVMDQTSLALEARTNPLAKLATAMFMSQRNQNYNIIRRAIRRGGKRAIRDLSLVMIMNPLIMAWIDNMRRNLYGHRDDEEAESQVVNGLFDVVEQNLSFVYGAQVAVDLVQIGRNLATGTSQGRFRLRENLLESTLTNIGQGMADIVEGVTKAGDQFEAGDKRGQSIAQQKLIDGLFKITIGIGTAKGLPISSPLRTVVGFGKNHFQTDYSRLFSERRRLMKREEAGKLSNFEQEKLGIIQEAMIMANLAHNAAENEQVDRDIANSYIEDRMKDAVFSIKIAEQSVPQATFAEVEKVKPDEQLLRDFYEEHGEALFKFQIARKQAFLLAKQAKNIKPSDRRAFRETHPEIDQALRIVERLSSFNATLAQRRETLTKPGLSAERRARLNTNVADLLQRANTQ